MQEPDVPSCGQAVLTEATTVAAVLLSECFLMPPVKGVPGIWASHPDLPQNPHWLGIPGTPIMSMQFHHVMLAERSGITS